MRGLVAQTVRPRELVIAWMQPEPAPDLPDAGCPVRHILVPGEAMPLAAARNRAASAASADLLVFLDVDCIPSPTLIEAYAEAAATARGLFLGEVRYLPPGPSISPPSIGFQKPIRPGRSHRTAVCGASPMPGNSGASPSRSPQPTGKRSAAWTRPFRLWR